MASTEDFIRELVKVVERELRLAEKGKRRAPEGAVVSFPTEHALIEELLIRLGYGGKKIYVRKNGDREPVGRIVEELIRTDYVRGANIFSSKYTSYLKLKLKSLGIKISDRYLSKLLSTARKELRRQQSNCTQNTTTQNNT